MGRDDTIEPGHENLVGIAEPDAFRVELSEEIVLQSAGGGEFQMPNAAEELRAGPPARPDTPVAPPDARTASRGSRPHAEAPAAEAPEPVLSEAEPAAELPAAAAAKARSRTSARRPSAGVRGKGHARPIGDGVLPRHAGGASRRRPSVSPTRNVDAGGARSHRRSGGRADPARPRSLSLNSVFGDEGTPSPPAVPPLRRAHLGPADGSVSFDDFFSPAGRGEAPRQARTPDTKSDDLDQFHSWLQNLKR